MRTADIPVEGLYITAFLILMSLAGMSLYLFIDSQSISSDYRIAAASMTELSESIKRLVDQERKFVTETVLYFFGSQSGIENVQAFGELNLSRIGTDSEVLACYNLLKAKLGSVPEELSSRCAIDEPALFSEPDSAGLWKCDSRMYSYESCTGITSLAALLCCRDSFKGAAHLTNYASIPSVSDGPATGYVCHQGCINALETDYESKCSNLDYCGALWCKNNNLEVPETYAGVPYYYKIIEPSDVSVNKRENGPGYFCPSSYMYTPEYDYTNVISWTSNLDMKSVINRLITLSNTYFYKPNPSFKTYIDNLLDADVHLAFQMDFIGCDDYRCEFAWVPVSGAEESFVGRGFGGVNMMDFSTNMMSLVTVNVPLESMVNFTNQLINDKIISNYVANRLNTTTFYVGTADTLAGVKAPSYWNRVFGEALGLNCGGTPVSGAGDALKTSTFDYYDNSSCGTDPYNNNCNPGCLLSWMSTKIYESSSSPLTYDRENGYDFNLRPVLRFIDTSVGAELYPSMPEIACGNGVCDVFETNTNCPADCSLSTCGNSVCDTSEVRAADCDTLYPVPDLTDPDYLTQFFNNANCKILVAGTPALSESSSNCPTDCSTVRPSISDTFVALPGEYNVFVKGTGPASVTITVDGTSSFNYVNNAAGEFYDIANGLGAAGRCSHYVAGKTAANLTAADLDAYYAGYGCCPAASYDEETGWCSVAVSANAYCQSMNNKYGNTAGGEYCDLDRGVGVNYANSRLNISDTVGNLHTLDVVCNGPCGVSGIDIIRVSYDNTFETVSLTSSSGVNYNRGGSYEYYKNAENCSNPMDADAVSYSDVSDENAWYSMLCLRGQGYGWDYIIDKETGIFNRFKQSFGSQYGEEAGKIDDFIETQGVAKCEAFNAPILLQFGVDVCTGSASFSSKEETNNSLVYGEDSYSLPTAENILERLYAINLNTSYMSLPMKWVFAYRDSIRFNQTMLGKNADCSLEYGYVEGAEPLPDCSCKECSASTVCDFNFENVPVSILAASLYRFEEIFIDSYSEYKSAGVME